MITAVFTDNDDYAHAYGLWQWDYGQQLRIEGLHLPTAVEIHFALQETGGEAITRVGTTKDGVTTVTIPDSVLEGNRATWTADKAYNIYAWVYLSDKSSGETIKRITMQVKSRPKPEAFEAPGDGEIFHEAIEAVNDAAKRAEEAGDKAVSAADEAKAAATQTAEHLQAVQKLSEQVEINADTVAQDKQTVAGMLSQTQQAASDAALSAQEAKLSETAAVQAQTGAEAAEDGARQYAEETGADRQAVVNDKQAVMQMREAVAADRKAVEQTAAQFGQTAQDALTAIGQAQSTAVGAVKAEGNKQTTAVQEAGTQAVEDITTEGDKQTKRIEDAAANLADGVMDLAPAIHSTVSDSTIIADDATEGRPFRGLRVFGKSTQVRTEGKNLFDITKFMGSENVINNGDGSLTINSYTVQKVNKIKDVLPQVKAGDVIYVNAINGTFVSVGGDVWDVNKNHEFSITEEMVDSGYLFFYGNKDNTVVTIKDIMISKEKNAVYEPYTGGKPSPSPEYKQEPEDAGKDGSIEVKVGGRNLFDGKFESGSIRQDNGENQDYADRIRTAGFIQIKPSTVYSIKLLETISFSVRWYDKDKKFIKSEATNTISQSPDNARYMRFLLLTTKLDTKCMVYAGSAPTPYEPYRDPQTLTLATPNGLPGIPVTKDGNYTDENGQQWICDEIDLERGKYVQRVAIEKNSGGWELKPSSDISGRFFQPRLTNVFQTAVKTAVCNIANFVSWGAPTNDIYAFALNKKVIYFSPPKGAEITAEELNAKLNSLSFPVVFVGELATPIERNLTPEEIAAYKALRTYGPTTVITNDAGAGMEATYVADTKAYIDKKFKELNQAIVNTQIALL